MTAAGHAGLSPGRVLFLVAARIMACSHHTLSPQGPSEQLFSGDGGWRGRWGPSVPTAVLWPPWSVAQAPLPFQSEPDLGVLPRGIEGSSPGDELRHSWLPPSSPLGAPENPACAPGRLSRPSLHGRHCDVTEALSVCLLLPGGCRGPTLTPAGV